MSSGPPHRRTIRSAWVAPTLPGVWISPCLSCLSTSSSEETTWQDRAFGSLLPCGSATSSPPSPSSTTRARMSPASWTASDTSSRSSSSLRSFSTSSTSASATGTASETASTHGPAGKRVGDLLLTQTQKGLHFGAVLFQFLHSDIVFPC